MNAAASYALTTARLSPDGEAAWGLFLFEEGTLGTETEEGPDGTVIVRGWFPAAADRPAGEWRARFRERYPAAPPPLSLETAVVAGRDYAAEARAAFAPLPLGESFVVCPPWAPDPPPEYAGRKRLVVNPGQAFGTGRHATTALALVLLERAIRRADPPPDRLADVGAGAGILAMAARALGVAEVHLADVDPVALEEAAANFRATGLPAPAALALGGPEALSGEFPLVVANIEAATLLKLADGLAARTAPGGALVLSGIRAAEAPAVERRFAAFGFAVEDRADRDGWVAFTLRSAG